MTSPKNGLNVRGLVAATAVAFAAVLAFAAPASAHNYYVSSTPGIDQVLTSLPDEFIVTTNDNLLELGGSEGGFFMEVKGPDGLYYGDGCVTVSGRSVTMPAALGPAGDYSLSWQVISADGHTVSDTIPFSWKPTAGEESAATGASTPPSCGKNTGSPATDAPAPTDGQAAASESSSDVLWIGGAIVAVAIAVIATLMLIRPKKKD
ncbi:MAG: copper resistance protein CopC [Cryobacterium sp.]|nr:copper resistance protein CopC [Cryobacterium sp.]